jgi:hypothetical protein
MQLTKSRSETPAMINFRDKINTNFEQMQKDRN